MMNPLALYRQAAAGLNLTPGQRALLRLFDGLAVAAFVTALPIIAEFLSRQDLATLDWLAFARYAVATLLVALLLAALKYARAHMDPQLRPVAEPLLTTAGQRAETLLRDWGGVASDVVIEPSISQVLPAVSSDLLAPTPTTNAPTDEAPTAAPAAGQPVTEPTLSTVADASDPFGPDGPPTLVRAAVRPASPGA